MTPDGIHAYLPCIGTSFDVAGVAIALQLEAVKAFETSATEGFSLTFTGPRTALVPQGIHGLHHADLGLIELFLVPVQDPRTEVYTYEAIFNRLRTAAQASTNGGA